MGEPGFAAAEGTRQIFALGWDSEGMEGAQLGMWGGRGLLVNIRDFVLLFLTDFCVL